MNKNFSTYLLLLNLLLIITIFLTRRNNSHQQGDCRLMMVNSINANKFEVNNDLKKLPFFPNQTDKLIKKDTSIILYELPAPKVNSNISVEETLFKRRSRRGYKQTSISPGELSQMLWAAYGVTHPLNNMGDGLKTCPSADGQYPLSIYVLAGNVTDLPKGVYKFNPAGHKLTGLMNRDKKAEICSAAENQIMIKEAPIVLVYTGIPEKLLASGQEIKLRWTNMEVGHSAQNVYLQATALNMGTCAIGSFNEKKVRQILNIPVNEQILYMMPVGYTIN